MNSKIASASTQDSMDDLGITEDQILRYEQDGVICLRGLIDDGVLARLRGATEAVLAGHVMNMSRLFPSHAGIQR